MNLVQATFNQTIINATFHSNCFMDFTDFRHRLYRVCDEPSKVHRSQVAFEEIVVLHKAGYSSDYIQLRLRMDGMIIPIGFIWAVRSWIMAGKH